MADRLRSAKGTGISIRLPSEIHGRRLPDPDYSAYDYLDRKKPQASRAIGKALEKGYKVYKDSKKRQEKERLAKTQKEPNKYKIIKSALRDAYNALPPEERYAPGAYINLIKKSTTADVNNSAGSDLSDEEWSFIQWWAINKDDAPSRTEEVEKGVKEMSAKAFGKLGVVYEGAKKVPVYKAQSLSDFFYETSGYDLSNLMKRDKIKTLDQVFRFRTWEKTIESWGRTGQYNAKSMFGIIGNAYKHKELTYHMASELKTLAAVSVDKKRTSRHNQLNYIEAAKKRREQQTVEDFWKASGTPDETFKAKDLSQKENKQIEGATIDQLLSSSQRHWKNGDLTASEIIQQYLERKNERRYDPKTGIGIRFNSKKSISADEKVEGLRQLVFSDLYGPIPTDIRGNKIWGQSKHPTDTLSRRISEEVHRALMKDPEFRSSGPNQKKAMFEDLKKEFSTDALLQSAQGKHGAFAPSNQAAKREAIENLARAGIHIKNYTNAAVSAFKIKREGKPLPDTHEYNVLKKKLADYIASQNPKEIQVETPDVAPKEEQGLLEKGINKIKDVWGSIFGSKGGGGKRFEGKREKENKK